MHHLLVLVAALSSAPGHAPPPSASDLAATPGLKRPLPDYDGRPDPAPTAHEALIWVPRVILYPAHAFAEYALRRPTVAALSWADRNAVWTRLYDAFTWDGGRGGLYPIFNVDFGLQHTFGVALFARELFVPANSLRVSASLSAGGGVDTSARDTLRVFRDGSGTAYLRSRFAHRPDGVFYGTGSDTRESDKTFYGYTARAVAAGLGAELGGLHRFAAEVAYRGADFGPSERNDDTPSVTARFGGPDQPPLPAGFDGYDLLEAMLALALDSRDPRIEETGGSGLRLEADVSYALRPDDTRLRFARWGLAGAAFYDFSGSRHVVALALATRFVERLGPEEVPFTELASLGGNEWMRGFLGGRFRGDSAVVASAQYRYPFWTFLDAELFGEVGNTFAAHLRGFHPQRLFLDYGAAFRTTLARDTSFAVTLAVGTNRFDATDFSFIDTTRVSLGVNHGF